MPFNESNIECWTFAGWEPDRQYRRMGGRGLAFTGDGAWRDAWRARVTSRENARFMAECGITVAMTHFYKGFGVQAEAAEWGRLREFIANCYAEGVKVWGYVQGRSLFLETLLAERPDAEGWAARDWGGALQTWGGSYYRAAPCLTSRGYLDYMKEVVRIGLEDIGLDGIHNDNSYYRHCWCERCARLFRLWLDARPDLEERTGLPSAAHVQPPPLLEGWHRLDPLQQLWAEFGAENRFAFLRQLREVARAAKSGAPYETNPAFPKVGPYKTRLCVDPSREAEVCDVVCAENSNLARMEGGFPVSQAEAFLHGDAGGYHVLATAWTHGPDGLAPSDAPGLLWAGLAEEFSHHAAMLGNNWLLRPALDGERVLGDDPVRREAHASAVRFFRGLHKRLALGQRCQWGELAVYVEPDALSHDEAGFLAFRALVAWSLMRRVPLVFAYPGRPVPESARALLVCQQSWLSDGRLEELAASATSGRAPVLLAGLTGRFDERGLARNESDWQAWRQKPGFVADAGRPLRWGAAAGGLAMARPTEECFGEMNALLDKACWAPRLSVEAPPHVLLNAEVAQDGRLLVHLRDQGGSEEALGGVRVRMGGGLADGRQVAFHAPEQESRVIVECGRREGEEVVLPAFRRYGLLVVG